VRGVAATKIEEEPDGSRTQRLVWPFWVDGNDWHGGAEHGFAMPPEWGNYEWFAIINQEGQSVGTLYIEFDRTTQVYLDGAIVFLILLTVSMGLWSIVQLIKQQIRIEKTSIELAQVNDELIRLERLAFTGRLTASLLHDLKKPVLAIHDEAENQVVEAKYSGEKSEEELAAWRDVAGQTNLFLGFLKSSRLERFAQSSAGSIDSDIHEEWCDIHELIDRALALVEFDRQQIDVQKNFDATNTLIQTNPYEFIQVFANIIHNAYQAMGSKGVLNIESQNSNQSGFDILKLTFADDGPGLSDELLASLFEPFQTSRAQQGGTGLGLYIARQILAQHEGEITASNNSKTSGACFELFIRLPKD
jgi:signal transduction histidine kinase